jgi:hypothetical protein
MQINQGLGQQPLQLLMILSIALNTQMKCAALFVDLSKAFDTVDHAILLNKLPSIGLSSDACSRFRDYLSDRIQAIVIDGVS